MFAALVILFVVVPFVELAVIVQVSQVIGLPLTITLLVVESILGGWLVKQQGTGVVRRVQQQVDAGQLPTTELVNGALVVFAGALMLTPGFVTDILGLVLLIPPTRALVRQVLMHRFRQKLLVAAGPLGDPLISRRGDVVDVEEVPTRHHEPGPLGAPQLGGRT